jgi:hypothetical protein
MPPYSKVTDELNSIIIAALQNIEAFEAVVQEFVFRDSAVRIVSPQFIQPCNKTDFMGLWTKNNFVDFLNINK